MEVVLLKKNNINNKSESNYRLKKKKFYLSKNLNHASQPWGKEEAYCAKQAHNNEHPQEDPINDHGNILPILLHLWKKQWRREKFMKSKTMSTRREQSYDIHLFCLWTRFSIYCFRTLALQYILEDFAVSLETVPHYSLPAKCFTGNCQYQSSHKNLFSGTPDIDSPLEF